MAPELRLSVGLDLAFFRQQMRKAVNIAQSEFTAQLQVKVNRQSLQRETEYLTRYFRRKNYRINVKTNLNDEIKKAQELTQTLANIDRALKAPAVAATRGGLDFGRFLGTKGQGTQVGLEDLKKLYRAAADAGLTEYKNAATKNKASIVKELEKIGEDSFIGFLNGLDSQDEKIKNAVKSLGKDLIATLKSELDIASPSKKLKKIGEDAALGFEIGLSGGLRSAKNRAVREMRGIVAALRLEALKIGDIGLGARVGGGRLSAAGRAGILPPAGMGRLDLNARQMPTSIPRVASSTGATGRMSMLPSSAIETYRMGGAQLALPSAEMRAAAAAAKSQERVAEAGKELTRSLRAAAEAVRTPMRPGLGILYNQRAAGYTGQIGPLPTGSAEPWSPGGRGMYGAGGFEPFMQARVQSLRSMFAGVQGLQAPQIGPGLSNYASSQVAQAMQALGITGGGGAAGRVAGLLPSREMRFAARTAAAQARGGSTGAFFAGGMGGGGGRPPQNLLGGAGFSGRGGGPTPPSGPGGFRGLSQQLSGLRQAMAPLQQARLPLTGAVAELGGEFGNAIKQVLLFGTAYKALAFILDIPSQAFEAARALASFENQLMAITGGGPAFEQSLAFINTTVERFNVPLESARTGFARLYASMNPAGIDDSTIQGLFTGISQAAATLSLTPDQVDRVTYAFSQMASKGKIMSEEVTGQLGDVIPGALSLMADAAGMSMADFKDAMEKGQLSGDAMGQVFNNLAIVFDERFGEGAKGAAKTLQGAITNINNSLKSMYEALSPIVNQFAQAFGPKIQSLIKDVTDVFTLLSGNVSDAADAAEALSPRARAVYDAIQQLAPKVKDAASSVVSLGKSFIQLTPLIVATVSAALQFLNTSLGRGLIVFAGAVGALTAAFGLLRATGLLPTIAALYQFIAAMTAAQAKQFAVWIAGLTKGMLGLRNAFKLARLSATLFTAALTGIATLGISLVIVGIAEAFINAGEKASEAANKVADFRIELDKLAAAGMADEAGQRYMEANTALIVARRERDAALAAVRRAEMAEGPSAPAQLRSAQERAEQAQQKVLQASRDLDAARQTRATAAKVALERGQEQERLRQQVTLGEGEGKGKGEKDKLKDYDRDLKNFYTNIARTESEAIKQRMDMTAREKEIALAVIDFNLKEKLAKAQYQRDIAKVNELVAADRAQYLADKKADLDAELKLAQQEFGTIVMSPFAKRAEEEVEAQNKLKASIAALKSGREELSAVEEAELLIQNELQGVTKEYADNLTPVIEKLRQATKETRSLTQERNALRDQLNAQRRLRLANIFDPAAELRERIRQRLGEAATPERVEEIARLEESAAMMEDLKGAVQGVRDEFAGLFSTMITGSGSAQEALAQSFANIGKSFADMAGKMIAQWLYMEAIGLVRSLFGGGSFGGGARIGEQVKMPTGVGFGAGGGILQNSGGQGFGTFGPNFGIRQFANGGIVSGPTLGLVGEGRYNEAVVPLPDGKSIPVELGGDAKNIVSNITVNVNNGQARSEGNGGANDLGRKLEGAVKQVIIEELRPGGVLAGKR